MGNLSALAHIIPTAAMALPGVLLSGMTFLFG